MSKRVVLGTSILLLACAMVGFAAPVATIAVGAFTVNEIVAVPILFSASVIVALTVYGPPAVPAGMVKFNE